MGHRDLREEADELRSEREFAEAGDKYTLAAYGILKESGLKSGYNPEFSEGLYLLLNSALAYRLDGNLERCRNRCRVGILIAEDAKEFIFEKHSAEKGLYNEYVGDFRLVGDTGDYDEAYGEAREFYEDVQNPLAWQAEWTFEINFVFLQSLADSVGQEIEDYEKVHTESLIARIEYKREHFPGIVDEVLEQGYWDWR